MVTRLLCFLRKLSLTRYKQMRHIEHNKRYGLLCACNVTHIPYYGDEGNAGGGKVAIGYTLHGYDYCETNEVQPLVDKVAEK